MKKCSRRVFLKSLGACAGLAFAGHKVFAENLFTKTDRAFRLLVIGDSLIWGQGLVEEEKFYHLGKRWLETEIFRNTRQVDLKVKAHSGASLYLKPFEREALQSADIDETETFHPEINVSFPSICTQVDIARKEYADPASVDLILLSGGITDIRLTRILNPGESNAELRRDIALHCNEKMFELLNRTAAEFPNALIAVFGYYPFLSKETPTGHIFNGVLEMYNYPRFFKPFFNNVLSRNILKNYRRKMIARSYIWAEDSNREFQKAIARLNNVHKTTRAIFIESPITAENAIGTKNPLLYEVGQKGRAEDPLAEERKTVCRETLDELRQSTDLKLKTRTCELASVGHPNPAGAKAYAEVFKTALKPFIRSETQPTKASKS